MTVDSTGPNRTRAPDPLPSELTDPGLRGPGGPSTAAEVFLQAWARQKVADRLRTEAARDRRFAWLLRRRRAVALLVLILLAVGGSAVGALYLVSEDIGDDVRRVPDVFGPLDPAARPTEGKSLTFLLVGTDTWSGEPPPDVVADVDHDPRSPHSDVLMIARLNADRTSAAVASIPRDSWVEIPGHGAGKVNTAYALGGAPLLVQTVENLTRIRVDHFAVIDFSGFQLMVDAVGGIDVDVDVPSRADGLVLRRGLNHLDGRQALAYVRRHGPADGDLDRAQRQQNALRALFTQVASRGMLSSPAATYDLLDAASTAVSVDDTLSNGGLRTIASNLDDLEPAKVAFVRAPVAAIGSQGPHAPVYLDRRRSAELWGSLRDDRVPAYVTAHPDDALGAAR